MPTIAGWPTRSRLSRSSIPGGEDRVYTSVLFFRTAEQFRRALDSAGFTGIQISGDWQGAPVEDSSKILVFRARRA